jgi:predicted ATPase/DNA-binding CsgD family transcriptional regulator
LETGGWVSPKRDVLNTGRTSNPRSTHQHNLPALRSSFVGRKREIQVVRQALGITRLLTLTGAGGSGKTRLALEVARGLIEAYPDGAWLVELAPLSEEVLVPKAVAEVLGVPERPAEPLADTLVEFLRDRQLLLVLDNCEHLLKATALLVDKLLDSCPRVRILATSREALGVEGEARRPVPPLSVPEPQGRPSSEDSSSSEGLEGYESVRLFIQRARERDPAFSLSPQNAPAVAEICWRLEGIPLALELAAARVGTLSLVQISQRLEGSLELLTRGGRTAVPRHRTLKGALEWSYNLLSADEKKLFGRLSVFAGGWALEASEAVGAGGGVEEGEVLDLLSGLVEKSLVMSRGDDPGGARYRLLEPVRQYALDKLEESDEAEEARRRHAWFFLGLAEETVTEMRGPEQAAWLDRLEAEHDNLRGALSWALERGEPELGLHLAEAFWWFWESRGYFVEGRWWLEQALAKGSRASSARAKALDGVGWMAFNVGDVERAVAAAKEGLKLRTHAKIEPSTAASLLRILALKAEMRGDYERATELFRESLDLGRETEDKLTMVWSVIQLGLVASDQGDHERATQLYEEGLALCLESGYTIPLPDFLSHLGYEFMLQGDQERATTLIEEATTLVRRLGQRRRPGGPVKGPLERLGWATLLLGDQERAKTWYEEHLRLSQELGNKLTATESLEGLACAVGPKREAERAAKLFGAAQGLREAVGYQKSPNERAVQEPYLVASRSRLEEAAWEAAFAEGRTMTLEEAVEYALSEEEPSTATLSSSRPEHPAGLTSREIEVLGLVAAGMTSAQIAKELFLSPRTVEAHLASIYHKLGVTSRAGATRFALEHGLT